MQPGLLRAVAVTSRATHHLYSKGQREERWEIQMSHTSIRFHVETIKLALLPNPLKIFSRLAGLRRGNYLPHNLLQRERALLSELGGALPGNEIIFGTHPPFTNRQKNDKKKCIHTSVSI